MKILVLDGESNSGRAILQSLGRQGNSCWLAAARPGSSAFASRYVRGRSVYPDPLLDKSQFLQWLFMMQAQEGFDLIIPSTEITLVPLHEVRDSAQLSSALCLPPASSLLRALDKEESRILADELGMMTPPTWVVERKDLGSPLTDLAIATAFPLVVKPRRSKVWVGERGTGLHTRVVHGPEQLEETLAALLPITDVQVQKWVPGHGVGIEVLANHGRIMLSFAHERLHEYPITGGASTYRRAIRSPEPLMKATTRYVEELQWHGVAMLEFRVDSQTARSWFMEINPRFWGSLPLPIFAGVDFPVAFVELTAGVVVPSSAPYRMVYARQFSADLRWLRDWVSMISEESSRNRHLLPTLLEWLRPLTGREIWDGASWRDPAPILHEILSVVRTSIREPLSRIRHARRRRWAQAMTVRCIQQGPYRKLLVACYGNICRSPYIAHRLRVGLGARDFSVRSAGFHFAEDRIVPTLFGQLAASRGVDLADHRSARMNVDAVKWADLIVVVDWDTYTKVRCLGGRACKKIVWLGTFDSEAPLDIADPYSMGAQDTAMIMQRMDDCSARLVDLLTANAPQLTGRDSVRAVV